jgi:hypothetical protein
MSQTIQAKVSGRILHKADRLFNNSHNQVLVELLQNARRAGATLVTVTTKKITDRSTEIAFTDNGSGIADYEQLLSLGESGWKKEVDQVEDPAGMGLFSLVHSGVIVRSRGREVAIPREAFLGEETVEVVDQKTADPEVGTTLIFTRDASEDEIKRALGNVVRYGSTPVTLNGTELPREDFLADAVLIKEVEGVRIGVLMSHHINVDRDWVNFHGMVISAPWRADLGSILLDEKGESTLMVYARVDVVSTSSLHLKLPDRAAVVQDEAYKRVWTEVKRTMFEYVAKHGRHIASYQQYQQAKELGIDIGDAVPYLRPWYAQPCDSDRSAPFDEDWTDTNESVCVAQRIAFVETIGEAEVPETFAFEYGLKSHQLPNGLVPVYPDAQFKGYSWYDSIPTLREFQLLVDGADAAEVYPESLKIVKQIGLSFELVRPTGEIEQIAWNDLVVAAWGSGSWDDQFTILVTDNSEWATKRSIHASFSLVALATYVGFSYRDDSDCDSYDTQEEYFEEQAEHVMVEILGGALEAARLRILGALDYNVREALNKANLTEVRLYKDEKGSWRADIPKAA